MKQFIIILIFICTFLPFAKGNEQAEAQAISTAQDWLNLIDQGNYAKSWDDAAVYFKGVIAKEDWGKTLKAVRAPLGNLISREIKSKQYATSLPGAPDGEYVVIQFATSFENKKDSIETVTPMLDEDGEWRVSGYYIR